ncbi:MAG: SOS response-associated peptidase family protein [Methylibium sp.]|nr:SOS response-associated peptidase family protein [Methylibium sp.]
MCANYVPVTRADRLLMFFGVQRHRDEPDHDVFPMGLAPFIRLAPPGTEPADTARFLDDGIFRFVPDFITRMGWARQTYNARSETVDRKATYKEAWGKGHRCIIPAEAIYEPNYESGSAVRWRIRLANDDPMGIAGIYRTWANVEGELVFTMALLTVNADDHPFMKRFHLPGEEKRMVVILDPEDYEGWLTCGVAEAKARYCRQWHGPLVGEPAPLPRRPPRSGVARPSQPTPPSQEGSGSLF